MSVVKIIELEGNRLWDGRRQIQVISVASKPSEASPRIGVVEQDVRNDQRQDNVWRVRAQVSFAGGKAASSTS